MFKFFKLCNICSCLSKKFVQNYFYFFKITSSQEAMMVYNQQQLTNTFMPAKAGRQPPLHQPWIAEDFVEELDGTVATKRNISNCCEKLTRQYGSWP
jgi:hypothetical protein